MATPPLLAEIMEWDAKLAAERRAEVPDFQRIKDIRETLSRLRAAARGGWATKPHDDDTPSAPAVAAAA